MNKLRVRFKQNASHRICVLMENAKRWLTRGIIPTMIQRVNKVATDKDKCDELFARYIKRTGYCRKCGRTDLLTTAHYIPRRYSSTRTDEHNACCLCLPCHRHLTDNPTQNLVFIFSIIGELEYNRLWHKARAVTKMDWAAELQRLKLLAK